LRFGRLVKGDGEPRIKLEGDKLCIVARRGPRSNGASWAGA
jgi:hypothetical protein